MPSLTLLSLPKDAIQHMLLFLPHIVLYKLVKVSSGFRKLVKIHAQEMRELYLEPSRMLETSAMYDSLPDEFHCLTDAAEFNYIREILPKLPTPPLHVAFTRDAGFPRSQPASASSLSDVAFRAILLTSFLTTSMISTVVPQHLNVLPAIENHQVSEIGYNPVGNEFSPHFSLVANPSIDYRRRRPRSFLA